ncbi:ISL3 family transposase [Streptomyces sp. CA-142005]|uniref:ISL3 family transposase n=1 Tax=Streptomyces sp. CA-142005 TaxID=3240052 RepID=UPI003D8B8F37
MDEFAFGQGCTYGTVLVDVEAGRVVDVLPDRTSETLAAWLAEHPGTEIVCRDRASTYTKAVKEAAPHALEVADGWHLLRRSLPSSARPGRRWRPLGGRGAECGQGRAGAGAAGGKSTMPAERGRPRTLSDGRFTARL